MKWSKFKQMKFILNNVINIKTIVGYEEEDKN